MRRALLLLAVGGCVSANTPAEETTPRQAAIYQSRETGTLLAEAPRSVAITIAAPPAAVWVAVKKVYSDFEIPVTVENMPAHQLGNANFYKSRELGGRPMGDFVDCGSGMTGPKASSYRIYISLLTEVSTDGKGGTDVHTTFVPMGQDMSGNSTDRIPCGSSGRFEQYFLDHVKSTLGK
ncbi:MAG: hypothetical protein JWM41_3576 [Gemmatimonadetes bacterium]|nr:hypothetical protein [Gemmatimonadota bacterium]